MGVSNGGSNEDTTCTGLRMHDLRGKKRKGKNSTRNMCNTRYGSSLKGYYRA